MKIIGQLENRKRGVYGGCIGYLGFDGDLDLCIGIRLAYRKGNQLVSIRERELLPTVSPNTNTKSLIIRPVPSSMH